MVFSCTDCHGREDACTQFQFCNGKGVLCIDWKTILQFCLFEGWEAPDRRSHLTDRRHQCARNDQRTSCPSAEELWELCEDDCCKRSQVWNYGVSTSSCKLASQHVTFLSKWKCKYLLFTSDILKCICGLQSEKRRTECSGDLKLLLFWISRYHMHVFKWSLLYLSLL